MGLEGKLIMIIVSLDDEIDETTVPYFIIREQTKISIIET